MKNFSITNVYAVLPHRVVENATVVIEDGIISSVLENGTPLGDVVDGRNAMCIPGVIDTHSDGLEMEPRPRPNVRLPLDFSLCSFEAKVQAAGITTLFHGIGYENEGNRTIEYANALVDEIEKYVESSLAHISHHVLYRLDARDNDGFEALKTRFEQSLPAGGPLVSFEDHTPGQGQYRDRSYFEKWVMDSRNLSEQEARKHVDAIIEERDAMLHNRERALPWLTSLAHNGSIRLMAHDPATEDDVVEAATWSASIAEFPTTIEAARKAREIGMRIVCGAPNVLRGGSHSGNVSASELISLGLCDGLSSDYLPFSMLGAVGTLVRDKVCSLVDAVGLVTSGPATTVGLTHRGRLEVGMKADLTLCTLNGSIPRVHGVHVSGSGHTPMLAALAQ